MRTSDIHCDSPVNTYVLLRRLDGPKRFAKVLLRGTHLIFEFFKIIRVPEIKTEQEQIGVGIAEWTQSVIVFKACCIPNGDFQRATDIYVGYVVPKYRWQEVFLDIVSYEQLDKW